MTTASREGGAGSEYMREALALARRGAGLASPNPMVGAVIVRDGRVAGRGFHTYAGRKHAEILALEEAGDLARGATMYVTLEPCSHHGRTAPCADAVIAAGLGKVVAAVRDPNPLVSGQGLQRIAAAGIEVEEAREFEAEAEKLNEPFFNFMRTGRPLVTLKAGLTLDGRIAYGDPGSRWITSEQARADVQQVRHLSDAILTGIGTVLADDCMLTDRTGRARSRPLMRIVVDSRLRIPVDSRIVRSAQSDLTVVTTSAASPERRRELEDRGVKVLVLDGPGGRPDLAALVQHMAGWKCLSLLIEAGSTLNWAALESGVADKILFYYAPKIFGSQDCPPVACAPGAGSRNAMLFRDIAIRPVAPDEFALEAWLVKRT